MPNNRIRPVLFVWDGEVMKPAPRFVAMCNRQYTVGEEYPLTLVEHRSMASHNHFFAACAEAWNNLPEDIAKRFPSETHLRRWALVQVGYATHRQTILANAKEARKHAQETREDDEYAVITINGNIVDVWRAKSQALNSMPQKEEFESSKRAVLDLLAEMIQVPRGELSKQAEQRSGRPERKRKTETRFH